MSDENMQNKHTCPEKSPKKFGLPLYPKLPITPNPTRKHAIRRETERGERQRERDREREREREREL